MQRFGLVFALTVLVFLTFGGQSQLRAQIETQAGVAAAVRGNVTLNRPSADIVGQQVQSGDPIFLGDAITSGPRSGMQIMLLSETVFTIPPNCKVRIDTAIYNPDKSTAEILKEITQKLWLFVRGEDQPSGHKTASC